MAVELAGVDGFSKASFYLDPLVQASTLDYFCSFDGGMEDSCATKEMLEHSLGIYERHLGEDHWMVARTLMNLAMAYGRLGDHNKEKNLLECALEIEEQNFGEAHFEVAKTLTNLANAHGGLGDTEQAEEPS